MVYRLGKFNSDAPVPAAILRKKTNGTLTHRAYSFHSDRTRSSESDTSNNSKFDPLVPQQKRELIHAKT